MSKPAKLNNLRLNYRQAMKSLADTKAKLIKGISSNKVNIDTLVEEYNSQLEAISHLQDMINDKIKE